jgi:hypothetical protein
MKLSFAQLKNKMYIFSICRQPRSRIRDPKDLQDVLKVFKCNCFKR